MQPRFFALIIALSVLLLLCASLFVSIIIIKLTQKRRDREKKEAEKKIRPVIKKLLSGDLVTFYIDVEKRISKLKEKLTRKRYLQILEDILLEFLESSDDETKVKTRVIAQYFGFQQKCITLIRDRLSGNIAIGCRKAGLYQFHGAIPDIIKVLDVFSSETHLQALMALARIGNSDALSNAFDKIHRFILINERSVAEVLNAFTGDRKKLYRNMISHKSEYIVHLFLKAIDRETANTFIESICKVSEKGGKELRLAGIVAIGKSGNTGKIPILVAALDDTEWEIRAMAAKTLGVLTGPEAILPLKKAAQDREWWVRQNAVTSILAYPGHKEILAAIVKTGDRFAYDSILYSLGSRAEETKLLKNVMAAWSPVIPEKITKKLVKNGRRK